MRSTRPQLNLAQQLSLLLVGSVLLAVLAMGLFTATQLRRGFSDYLRAQDEARLSGFAELARHALQREGVQGLRERPEVLWASLEGGLSPREARPGGWHPSPRPPPPNPGRREPFDPRAARGFALVDLQGQLIWGRPPPRRMGAPLEEPVQLDGQIVAIARLYPRPEDPGAQDERDRRFLRSQMGGLLAVGAGLALLSALAAWWIARRWTAPLRSAQDATHRLAQGDFTHRLVWSPGFVRDETDALAADLNHLAEALQNLDGSRRRWIAELSHELRTPLTILRGEIDSVLDGVRVLNHERLAALQAEVSRLTRLADDFALLARSDLQALPVQLRDVAVAPLLQAAEARWQPAMREQGMALSLALDPSAPSHLPLDPERCAQVLDNLLANALAYTQAPGEVLLWQQGLRWGVDDSPPGVPDAAERERLFEPLYRADPSRRRQDGGGSGLGLAIARALVQAQGGQIRAEPSPLGGLRVAIDWSRP